MTLLAGMAGTFIPYDAVPALQELRALAPFPSNADLRRPALLPAKVTSFFSDNFGGRKLLVREYFRFRLRVLEADVGMPAVLGKNDWLIVADEVRSYRNDPAQIPATAIEQMRRLLESWCLYAQERGAVMVFVIGPNKTTIYPQVPDYFSKRDGPTIIDRINELRIDCPLIRVDLRKTLRANAHQPLYFKWGTHWNNTAAQLVWREIKAAVIESGRRLRWPSAQVAMTHRPASPWEDSMWAWFGLPDPERLTVPTPTYSERKYDSDPASPPIPRARVLAFGDSFLQWMEPTAYEVVGTFTPWNMNVEDQFEYKPEDLENDGWILAAHPWQKRIELMDIFRPNIVILEVVERGMHRLPEFLVPASTAPPRPGATQH